MRYLLSTAFLVISASLCWNVPLLAHDGHSGGGGGGGHGHPGPHLGAGGGNQPVANSTGNSSAHDTDPARLHGGGNQPFSEQVRRQFAEKLQHEQAEIRRLKATHKSHHGTNSSNATGASSGQLLRKEEKLLLEEQLAKRLAANQHKPGVGNLSGNAAGTAPSASAGAAPIHHAGPHQSGGHSNAPHPHSR